MDEEVGSASRSDRSYHSNGTIRKLVQMFFELRYSLTVTFTFTFTLLCTVLGAILLTYCAYIFYFHKKVITVNLQYTATFYGNKVRFN